MIRIQNKVDCCGCEACVQVCPISAIVFNEDECGFGYPVINEDTCVNCGLCEKVCPILNKRELKSDKIVYASINPDNETRLLSSSGGVFSMISEYIIENGGVVFGAAFNSSWDVEHRYVENKSELYLLRGSKYVQSRIGDAYKHTKCFLEQGRKVLFSGTPCQIAGLKNFLRKEYDNLILLDVACHAVPSPLVWRRYLDEKIYSRMEGAIITDVSFREKSTGWSRYSVVIKGKEDEYKDVRCFVKETVDKNIYMQIFLNDLSVRPSCVACPAKLSNCCSDLTLADYWGIGKINYNWDDSRGTSMVVVNTYNGEQLVKQMHLDNYSIRTSFNEAVKCNPSLIKPIKENKDSKLFWEIFQVSGFKDISSILRKYQPSFTRRVLSKVKQIISKMV